MLFTWVTRALQEYCLYHILTAMESLEQFLLMTIALFIEFKLLFYVISFNQKVT